MGNRTEPASKGDADTIISRVMWLSQRAKRGDLDLTPGPSFSFYQDRWGSDALVNLMSMADRGMHLTLMCCAWQQTPFCSLPDEEVMLRAWCGHPESSSWPHHQAVLLSSRDGSTKRSWVFRDDRWWQIGLCRTLLEQVSRRLRRQKASHARYGRSDGSGSDASEKHVALEFQCSAVLLSLQCLPVPVPVPVAEATSVATLGSSNSPMVENPEVTKAWDCLVKSRSEACRLISQKPSALALTAKRFAHLNGLVSQYGVEELCKAFGAVVKSDYHLGTGRHQAAGPRLSFESFTGTSGKVNQVEILMQLAENPINPKARSKPFAPAQDPQGDDDDGSEIE